MRSRRRGPTRFWILLPGLALSACQNNPTPLVSWALVLPDGADTRNPAAEVWRSAAAEEGYTLKVERDSDLMRPWTDLRDRHPVLIFPDGLHAESPPVLFEKIRAQLAQGDSIVIGGDTFSKDYPGGALSSLCPQASVKNSDVFAYKAARFGAITSPLEITGTGGETKTEGGGALLQNILPPGSFAPANNGHMRWVGYQAEEKNLAHAITTGTFQGQVLASDPNGEPFLGIQACGPGHVFFANLPLTYLKSRTDGALLHAVLKLIDQNIQPSARLLPTPDGVGGLVLNIHVDSNAAIQPLKRLDEQGFFGYGPFSVHVTAGPDARATGDHLGFDLDHRAEARLFLARLSAQGHAIGSHGGWIHDYFGKNLTPEAREPFISYLRLNLESLQKATGQPVTEYSAPMGNHPAWVTRWLEEHGVTAYYTTGNVGLGPTRTYLDGVKLEKTAWAFPVNTLGTWASLEEFHEHGYGRPEVAHWLKQLTQFAADSREIRLFYSHPPGLEVYSAEILDWLRETRLLETQVRFRWYRMGELTKFLNRREKASWSEKIGTGDERVFQSSSPESLEGLTWCLPKTRYAKPRVEVPATMIEPGPGAATDPRCWLVRAGAQKDLRFTALKLPPLN